MKNTAGSAWIAFAAFAAIALTAGCASVPLAGANEDAQAKSFVAPGDGRANLYVYRDETFGAGIKMPLLLDNLAIGDTAAHTYVYRQVAPGRHLLVSKTEKDVSLEIEVEAGRNYFVWQEVKMGVWTARSALHLVDEKMGEVAVKKCKLIQ
jgi:hypothetical protein